MTRWLPLFIGGMLLSPLPVLAQEITEAVVRGNNVSLRAEPDADADLVSTLQRGDAIRITGDAETASGETKSVTVDTLGTSRSWFVPVEVVETGDAGWIAELFISPRGLTIAAPVTGSPVPTATEVPTATAAPTATQVPTAPPAPTATQVPTQVPTVVPTPTATQIPTSTPAAVATQPPVDESPQQGLTPKESAYFDEILPVVQDVGESLDRFTDVTESPRIGNSSWEALLQHEADIWNESYALALAITPPDSLSEFHDTVLLSLSSFADAGDEVMVGVRNFDIDALDRATVLIEEGGRQTEIANDLLEEFKKERGIFASAP